MTDFLIGREVLVDSVGLRRRGVDPFAVAVMDEIGIDLAHHRAKTFDDLDDEPFDLIVSLSPEAQHHAVEMTRRTATEVEFWKTFDPSIIEGNRDVRLTAYRGVRDALLSRIKQRFTLPGTPV